MMHGQKNITIWIVFTARYGLKLEMEFKRILCFEA
jgi:hypothetical protein